MSKMKGIKAILIDFDGTLLDSLPALYKTYFEFMKKVGLEGSSDEFRLLNGLVLDEAVIFLREKYQINEPLEDLQERYHTILQKNYHAELKLFPGTRKFLSFAASHALKLAIVSAGVESYIESILKAEEVFHFFDVIVTPKEGQRSKPAPDLYLTALDFLKISSKEAIAIEDSTLGVQAALKAGISTLQMTHGLTKQFFKEATTVHNWEDALAYVKDGSKIDANIS